MASSLTFDKSSARHVDANGYMHVSETPISKAIVNPYRGSEIPNAEQLGLDPNKVYYLLRDPKELKRAASTFNNLPILDKHIPVSALDLNDPDLKKHVVGSTGTDAEFKEPYLVNSMVLHTASAIKDVEAGSKAELSCAYRYKPVMTPGTYEGKHYDGVMTELEGNHVAIVNEGRAGHDVKVMDSKLKERPVDYTKLAQAFGYDHAQERLRAALPALDAKDCAAGSITMGSKDANPEGINQYGALRGIATKASERAKDTGRRDDHIAAARAHLDAAGKAPNALNKSTHMALAKYHMAALPGAHDKKFKAYDDDDDETNGTVREIAEKDAEAAGKLAMLQPSKRNRELAAKAYQEAAREHRKAGFPKQARYHDNMAKEFTKPVGEDANPEGANQYTSASAGKASAKAIKSKKVADHKAAAAEHRGAMKTAASPATKAWHSAMAAGHVAAAEGHSVKFGRNFGDVPKIGAKAHDAAIAKRKDISPKQGITEYGSVRFADPMNKRYPIDTPAHVRAAASYFGKAKNRNEYSQEDQKIIDKRISAAKKKFKIGAEATESK